MKRFLSILLAGLLLLSIGSLPALANEEYDYQSLYKPVLDMFYENLANDSWPYLGDVIAPAGYDCYSYAVDDPCSVASQIEGFFGPSGVGYQMTDLNGDGVPELLIARCNAYYEYDDICDIYTISAYGEVVHLASDCDDGAVVEGHFYDVNAAGQIIGTQVSGAVGESHELCVINSDGTGIDLVAVLDDYWDESAYYYTEDVALYNGWHSLDTAGMQEITGEQYQALMQQMTLQLTLFSNYSSAGEEEQTWTEPAVTASPAPAGLNEWQSLYQSVLNSYGNVMADNAWESVKQDMLDSENINSMMLSAPAVWYAASGSSLYYALVDVDGNGVPELLIGIGNADASVTAVDLMTTSGRLNHECVQPMGGGITVINITEDRKVYYVFTAPAGGIHEGFLCSIVNDGQGFSILDSWEKLGGMAPFVHDGTEYPDEEGIEEWARVEAGYGNFIDVQWTQLAVGCSITDAPVQTIEEAAEPEPDPNPESDSTVFPISFDEDYTCTVGETVNITAICYTTAVPSAGNFIWSASGSDAVRFGDTSIMGPAETGEENVYWVSVPVTALSEGSVTINLDLANGYSGACTSLTIESDTLGEWVAYRDRWSFLNWDLSASDYGFDWVKNGYYITRTDYNRLLKNLDQELIDALRVEDTPALFNIDGQGEEGSYRSWGGSCFGMSVLSCLYFDGVFSTGSGSGISSLPLTDQLRSNINFYYVQQRLPVWQNLKRDFTEKTQVEQLQDIEDMLEEGRPVLLAYGCISGENSSYGHAIVVYGREDGNWTVTVNNITRTYESRFLVYDCNSLMEESEQRFIYYDINESTGESYLAMEAANLLSKNNSRENSSDNNGRLEAATNNVDILNSISYADGSLSYYGLNSRIDSPRMYTDTSEYDVSVGSAAASVAAGAIISGNIQLNITELYDGGESAEKVVFLPESSSYSFTAEENIDFAFADTDVYASVQSETSGTAEFDPSGAVVLDADGQAQCSLVMRDYGKDVSWTETLVSGSASYISAEYTDGGVLITGRDLQDAAVTIADGDSSVSADLPDGDSTLLVKADDSNNGVILYEDSDGDGKYDENYSDTHHTHTAGDEVTVIKEATCTETGLISYVCGTCGEQVSSEVTPALGHDWGATQVVSAAACENAGTGTQTCARCGETRTVALPPAGHKWDEGMITKQPTLTEKGTKVYTCSVCGAATTEEINVLQAAIETIQTIPRTGDDTQIMPYLLLIVCGGGAMTVIGVSIVCRKKRNKEN